MINKATAFCSGSSFIKHKYSDKLFFWYFEGKVVNLYGIHYQVCTKKILMMLYARMGETHVGTSPMHCVMSISRRKLCPVA